MVRERRSNSGAGTKDHQMHIQLWFSCLGRPFYLDEVFGVWGKGWVEDQVVEVGVFLRAMVGKVDKVLNVVVRVDVAYILQRGESYLPQDIGHGKHRTCPTCTIGHVHVLWAL